MIQHPLKLVYKNGSSQDRQQMQDLGRIAYGQFAPQLKAEDWETMCANFGNNELFEKLISVSGSFVCEHNNKVIAMAFLVPSHHPHPLFEAGWSYIRMVAVHPDFEGAGIGKTLTEMCIAHAARTNERIVALHTSELMNAARHIYEKLGFTIAKEIGPIYGLRYWIYTLDLSSYRLKNLESFQTTNL